MCVLGILYFSFFSDFIIITVPCCAKTAFDLSVFFFTLIFLYRHRQGSRSSDRSTDIFFFFIFDHRLTEKQTAFYSISFHRIHCNWIFHLKSFPSRKMDKFIDPLKAKNEASESMTNWRHFKYEENRKTIDWNQTNHNIKTESRKNSSREGTKRICNRKKNSKNLRLHNTKWNENAIDSIAEKKRFFSI